VPHQAPDIDAAPCPFAPAVVNTITIAPTSTTPQWGTQAGAKRWRNSDRGMRSNSEEGDPMKTLTTAALLACVVVVPAFAAGEAMKAAPAEGWTVTNYYKQSVYDTKQNEIGKVDDVLLDKQGKVSALIVGVGGFLGMGEKDVAVPFAAVKSEKKNDKFYLTLDETKDSLKAAPGFKYDRTTTTWVLDKNDTKTTGTSTNDKTEKK
jgi:sporulation protein YlmC with PRC-barrel domain